MSAADRHQPQPTPPSADQLRMFFQSMQQQFQPPQSQSNSTPTATKSSNSGEKLSPSLDENNVLELLMNNPDYQRLLNYSQMSQSAQAAPVQHPLAAAAANPENPAFRALIAHSSGGGSALPFGVYPNFVPEMHPEMMAANPYYANGMPFGPYMGGMDAGRRKNATREVTMPLKKWLSDHRRYPYPNKAEKMILAIITKMSLTQVSTWFANARRRLKKENKMTWSPRCRPGGEDDEDDLDDNEPLSPSISINSSDEIKRDAPTTNSFDGQKSTKREHPDSNTDEAPTPKRKILSVNDMLSNSSRQSPNRVEKCKSPLRSTTPPSSSTNGTIPDHSTLGMPPMGQFPPPSGQFPFPFLPNNAAPSWNPQMMAMMAAQNAARNPSFNGMPQMNPNFLQQMMVVQQMASFMRTGAPQNLPPQLNPNMLAAMQGFFPTPSNNMTNAPSTSSSNSPTITTTKPTRPETNLVKTAEQAQSPSVVNTSSSSVSESNGNINGNTLVETQQANSTNDEPSVEVKKEKTGSQSSSPKPQSQPSKPVAAH